MSHGLEISLDRSRGEPLHDQIYRQLKYAIASGKCRAGEALPSIRDLARMTGAGENTARHALMRLAAEGLTTMRRHVGSIVADGTFFPDLPRRILFCTSSYYFGFYFGQLVAEIRKRLTLEGRGIQTSFASGYKGGDELEQLSERLKARWDLIVKIDGEDIESRRAIEMSGWPFVTIGNGWKTARSRMPSCVGTVELRMRLGVLDFVHDCIRKGVRRVLQVCQASYSYNVAEALAVADIATETIMTGVPDMPADVERDGLEATRKRLSSRTLPMPDVVFFTDDHLGRGGLYAISNLGLKVPEDVKVVTHVNKGNGPVWIKSLTRLEMDPVEHGRAIAEAIAGHLAGNPFPDNLVLGSRYIRGETF
jgi:DNA-binding LacI/PurR family transcriptional regulator